ncbi:hypothetical protein DYB32_008544 [Aphanomyces invadans]|uniref:DUF1279 domain-containing protein n=1 Tax=Aphanomyces invadans TaxID=157072 RepID=A0A3R6YTT2_9STRA|nr:hypothetical protein DYB32_008544 [Aphanomyces invadans]
MLRRCVAPMLAAKSATTTVPAVLQVVGTPRVTVKANLVRPRPLSFRFNSTSSTPPPITTAGGPLQKFKDLWNKYGWVGVGTYLGVYVVTLGSMFVAIETGVLSTAAPSKATDSEDKNEAFNIVTATNKLTEWTKSVGLGAHFNVPDVSPTTGTFLIAWVATKFTEPVRLAVTLMITPRLARFLKTRKA